MAGKNLLLASTLEFDKFIEARLPPKKKTPSTNKKSDQTKNIRKEETVDILQVNASRYGQQSSARLTKTALESHKRERNTILKSSIFEDHVLEKSKYDEFDDSNAPLQSKLTHSWRMHLPQRPISTLSTVSVKTGDNSEEYKNPVLSKFNVWEHLDPYHVDVNLPNDYCNNSLSTKSRMVLLTRFTDIDEIITKLS